MVMKFPTDASNTDRNWWWWVYSLLCIHVRSKLFYFSRIIKWKRFLFSKPFHDCICLAQPFWFEFLEFDVKNNVELQCFFGNNCCWGACSCSHVWWGICTGRDRVKSKQRGRNLLAESGASQVSDPCSAFITSALYLPSPCWKKRLP